MAVLSTPAVALRAHPYGETSLVLRFYTEELGLVGVMAKGARRRSSRGSGTPDTFSRGVLTLYVKEGRDLHTMKDFAPESPRRALGRDVLRFAAASVLGEILLRHAGAEGIPSLFRSLDQGLDRIASAGEAALPPILLARSWSLIREMGYLPVLERCVACGRTLGSVEVGRFDLAAGGIRCSGCGREGRGRRLGPVAREQLRSLFRGEPCETLRKPEAHLRLLHDFTAFHLSEGRPLDAFRVLLELVQEAGESPSGLVDQG